MDIDQDELARLTESYGGAWGIHHTRRLLKLVAELGQGLDYNAEALWVAAHLHDWGAYAAWAQKGVEHVVRSGQVAEQYLSERGCSQDFKALVLEIIALHHAAGSEGRSLESILLRDGDGLDFLGVVGVLRNFSMYPRDMRMAVQEARRRQARVAGALCLEKARDMAAVRIREMDELLAQFEVETFGDY